MAKKLAVGNQKGGVGKTTTAVNLAASLSKLDFAVLLVDMESQGNATDSCGASRDVTLYALFQEGNVDVLSLVQGTKHGFDVIAADMNLAAVEQFIKREEDLTHYEILKKALEPLEDLYHFIIFDMPPAIGVMSMNALVAADELLIPLVPEQLPVDGVQDFIRTVGLLHDDLNPGLRVAGVVFTKVKPQTKHHREARENARRFFGELEVKVCETEINDCIDFADAPTHGVPAVLRSKKNAVQAYVKLACELFVHEQ